MLIQRLSRASTWPRISKKGSPLQSIIEKITALLAAFTVLIVALSVSHELGYFAYIGGRFFQTFLTATDYFTNAILWLPVAALTAIGWINYDWIWKQTPVPKKKEWRSWILPTIIIGIPVLCFVFLPEGPPTFYFMLFLYLWVLFSNRFISVENAEIALYVELLKLVKIGIPVCVALFTLGYISAKSDLNSFSGAYVIRLTNQGEPILRIPLRNFDKGLLARDAITNRIEFIRWDAIRSVSKPSELDSGMALGCRWFGIWCKAINNAL